MKSRTKANGSLGREETGMANAGGEAGLCVFLHEEEVFRVLRRTRLWVFALQETGQCLRRCLWRKDAVVAGQRRRGDGEGERRVLEDGGTGEEDIGDSGSSEGREMYIDSRDYGRLTLISSLCCRGFIRWPPILRLSQLPSVRYPLHWQH